MVFRVQTNGMPIDLHPSFDTQEFVHAQKRQTIKFVPVGNVRRIRARLDPWSDLVVGSSSFADLFGEPSERSHRQQFLWFR
jgi:hypothetical protein